MDVRSYLIILAFAVIAVACGGGGNDGAESRTATSDGVSGTATSDDVSGTATTVSGTPTSPTATAPCVAAYELNPVELFDHSRLSESDGGGYPGLGDPLLNATDVPSGYVELANRNFVVSSACGPIEISLTVLVDVNSVDEQVAVIGSIAVGLPESVLTGGYEGEGLLAVNEDVGFVHVLGPLDASGLGEVAAGFDVAVEVALLLDPYPLPFEPSPIDSLVGEAYVFLRGDRLLQLIALWPQEQEQPPVNARELAQLMDGRAAAD